MQESYLAGSPGESEKGVDWRICEYGSNLKKLGYAGFSLWFKGMRAVDMAVCVCFPFGLQLKRAEKGNYRALKKAHTHT